MKRLKYIYILLVAAAMTTSCSSDDPEIFGVKPTGGVTFTPTPGGAVMNYTLPNEGEIANIRVRYNDVNGKEVVVMGSYLSDHLTLVGFNEARQNVPAFISYVNRQGVCSEEYATTFNTVDSGPYAFFKTAEVTPAWNGFELRYELPEDGMNGFAHVFYVGVNPNTQKTDTLLLGSITLAKGEAKKYFTLQQQLDKNTIMVKTEDFRGYFVKQQVWSDIPSYPTEQVDGKNIDIECPLSYESEENKLGIQYLTDGDTKGLRAVVIDDFKDYYTFAMGPYAFGEDIIVDLREQRVPATVRIYTQLKCKDLYTIPIWKYNYVDTLPCEVDVYGSNDKETWTKLGNFSEPADGSGSVWWSRDNLVNRLSKLTYEQVDAVDPIYLEVIMPLSDTKYRYVKVVPVKTFDTQYDQFRNTEQYVTMQELEIYVKK